MPSRLISPMPASSARPISRCTPSCRSTCTIAHTSNAISSSPAILATSGIASESSNRCPYSHASAVALPHPATIAVVKAAPTRRRQNSTRVCSTSQKIGTGKFAHSTNPAIQPKNVIVPPPAGPGNTGFQPVSPARYRKHHHELFHRTPSSLPPGVPSRSKDFRVVCVPTFWSGSLCLLVPNPALTGTLRSPDNATPYTHSVAHHVSLQ